MTIGRAQVRRRRIAPLLCLALSGCSGAFGGDAPPTRYYVLSTVSANPPSETAARSGPGIGINLISIPDYLDHPGLTTRSGTNQIVRAQSDQWAGPLSEEVLRVVAENISLLLPGGQVTVASGRRTIPLDYVVEMEIAEFLREETGAVSLVARWNIIREIDRSPLAVRTSRIRRPASGADHNGTVAAMSAVLEELSREIAQVISSARTASKGLAPAGLAGARAPGLPKGGEDNLARQM